METNAKEVYEVRIFYKKDLIWQEKLKGQIRCNLLSYQNVPIF